MFEDPATNEYAGEPYHAGFTNPMENYQTIIPEYMEKMEGQMSWIWDWIPEPLPLENKEGSSMMPVLEAAEYLKLGKALPRQDETKAMKILVFPDRDGLAEQILGFAPEGRVSRSKMTVVRDPPEEITTEYCKKLMHKTTWDLIVFGYGLNRPAKSNVTELIKCQDIFTKVYLSLAQSLVDPCEDGKIGSMAILARGCFTQDKDIHNNGIGVVAAGNLYGMTNSVRAELGIPVQYLEFDWYPTELDMQLMASELFRKETFGYSAVWIHKEQRYVHRQFYSTSYEKFPEEFEVPDDGIIGISGGNGAVGIVMGMFFMQKAELAMKRGKSKNFQIKLLSRSMKVPEESQKTWKECQELAAKLGLHVEQARLDCGDRDAVHAWIAEHTPNLRAFIHSAGVLRDSMLPNQTWQKYEDVYNSKHRGALYVHEALMVHRNPGIHVWLFSSDSVYGNQSATNYSGSNSFQDSLCRHNRANGHNWLAIQWGSWGEVGMAANLSAPMIARINNGFHPMNPTKEMLRGLDSALRTQMPVVSVWAHNLQSTAYMTSQAAAGDPFVKAIASLMDTIMPCAPIQDFSYANAYLALRTIQRVENPPDKMDPKERIDYGCIIEPRIKENKSDFCWGPVEDGIDVEDVIDDERGLLFLS